MIIERLLGSFKAEKDIRFGPEMILFLTISADKANCQDLEATSTQSTWQAASRVTRSCWTSPQTHLARQMIVSELQNSLLQIRGDIRRRLILPKTSTQSLSTLGLTSLATTAAPSSTSTGNPKSRSISPPQIATSRSQNSQGWMETENDLKPLYVN